MTVDSNENQIHAQLLRHGMLGWVTRGVLPRLPAQLPRDAGRRRLPARRALGHDARPHARRRADHGAGRDPVQPGQHLHLGRRGGADAEPRPTDAGLDAAALPPDPHDRRRRDAAGQLAERQRDQARHGLQRRRDRRVPCRTRGSATDPMADALLANRSRFRWINHTFTHLNLDALPGTGASSLTSEIGDNIACGQANALPFDPEELVTGEHSGLHNAAMPGHARPRSACAGWRPTTRASRRRTRSARRRPSRATRPTSTTTSAPRPSSSTSTTTSTCRRAAGGGASPARPTRAARRRRRGRSTSTARRASCSAT